MPQIQVLPAVPTFGSKLAAVIGDLGTDFAKGIEKRRASSALDKLLNPQKQQEKDQAQPNANGQPNIVNGQPQNNPQAPSQNQPANPPLDFNRIAAIAKHAETIYGKDATNKAIDAIIAKGVAEEKEGAQIRKFEREQGAKEQEKIDTMQKGIIEAYQGALKSEANLNKSEKLVKEGNITSPLTNYLFEKFQIPIGLLGSKNAADTEEFRKLGAQRGLQVATAYGFGNIRAIEFANFMKTIPDLLTSAEGKQRIIDTLRYFDNIAKAQYEIYKDIRSERKPGQRQADVEFELNERLRPQFAKFDEILQNGSNFPELPDPKTFKGERFYDEANDQVLESDGKEWKPVGK